MEGFTLTKRSFDFQPCETVALLLRECIELIQPSAIFSLARCTISFLMNLQSTVVGSQLTDTFSAFSLCFFAAASSNVMHRYRHHSKNQGQAATLHYAAALHCPSQTFLANIFFWLKGRPLVTASLQCLPPARPLREQTRKQLQGET
jgi:hypothetical protein